MRAVAANFLHPLVFADAKVNYTHTHTHTHTHKHTHTHCVCARARVRVQANHEYVISSLFEALPEEPVRGRVRICGLKTNPPEEQIASIFREWQTQVSPGGIKVELGAMQNTWDVTVSFESETAAQEACALIHSFIPGAGRLEPLEPPSPAAPSSRSAAHTLSSPPTSPLAKRQFSRVRKGGREGGRDGGRQGGRKEGRGGERERERERTDQHKN
jgi:hypothetical protein